MYQNNSKRAARKNKKNRQVQFLLLALILLFTIVGILAAVYLLSGYNSRNTFEYQYNASAKAYENADYDKAIKYIDRALDLEDTDEEKIMLALSLKYSTYIAKKDYNGAIKVLLQMIEKEETAQRYTSLLELYSLTGNYVQIEELGNRLTDTQYYDIYKNYMVGNVAASLEDGTYDKAISVELTASKADLVIHYTIDGSKPTVESDIYNGVIQFSGEGTHTLRAIGINAQGVISEELVRTYVIAFKKTDKPVIAPLTGDYTSELMIEVTGMAEGCKAYYTLDGTTPTLESAEYTGPISIKCGNYVLGVVAADEKGTLSDVVWRIYNVEPNNPFAYQSAVFKLKNKLIEDGIMLDMDGNTSEGTTIKINFIDYASIDENGNVYLEGIDVITGKKYYVFNITSEYNGLVEQFAGYYCISVDDGTLLEVNSVNE